MIRRVRLPTLHSAIVCGLAATLCLSWGGFNQAKAAPASYWFRIYVPDNLVPGQIGSAAFRLGHDEVLVFAAPLPIRQSALRQITGLPGASVEHLPDATVLRIPLPAHQTLDTTAETATIDIAPGSLAHFGSIDPSFVHGRITFPVIAAGPVVSLSDEQNGRTLLIGTVTGPAALDRQLSGPGYGTVPASRGVVIIAKSDELSLVMNPAGFTLTAPSRLPVGSPPVPAPQVVTPRTPGGLNLSQAGIIALRRRMQSDRRLLVNAPPLNRRSAALRLARVLLALDLAPEARGVLSDLVRSDPTALDDPQRLKLLAVADILADRSGVAAALWPAVSDKTVEAKLWRGLGDAESGKMADAAKNLANVVSSLVALPPLIRVRMVPLAAETLIAEGQDSAAQILLDDQPHAPYLALARAEILAAKHPHAALAGYIALLRSPDPRTAGIAHTRAILMRYRLHEIDARAAATRLSAAIYEWRGARHELNTRLTIARLRAKAGDWPSALMGLIRAEQIFPDRRPQIDKVRTALFHRMIASGALDHMPPLAAVAVIQNNTDLVPSGAPGVPILKLLSRHLIALDLPDPAMSIMQQLIARAPTSASRARLGFGLARIDLGAGHLNQALAALKQTDAAGLGAGLTASRALVADEIAARQGRPSGLASLLSSPDRKTLVVAARLAFRRNDWPAAEKAFGNLATIAVPAAGRLNSRQARIVAQWATAALRAGDEPEVALLRRRYATRLPAGSTSALFDTITALPMGSHPSLSTALKQIASIERINAAIAPSRPDAAAATSNRDRSMHRTQ